MLILSWFGNASKIVICSIESSKLTYLAHYLFVWGDILNRAAVMSHVIQELCCNLLTSSLAGWQNYSFWDVELCAKSRKKKKKFSFGEFFFFRGKRKPHFGKFLMFSVQTLPVSTLFKAFSALTSALNWNCVLFFISSVSFIKLWDDRETHTEAFDPLTSKIWSHKILLYSC